MSPSSTSDIFSGCLECPRGVPLFSIPRQIIPQLSTVSHAYHWVPCTSMGRAIIFMYVLRSKSVAVHGVYCSRARCMGSMWPPQMSNEPTKVWFGVQEQDECDDYCIVGAPMALQTQPDRRRNGTSVRLGTAWTRGQWSMTISLDMTRTPIPGDAPCAP